MPTMEVSDEESRKMSTLYEVIAQDLNDAGMRADACISVMIRLCLEALLRGNAKGFMHSVDLLVMGIHEEARRLAEENKR